MIFRRRQLYNDLSEEIQLHIEERAEALMRDGMSPEEAATTARRAFGNRARLEERSREVWQWPTLESIWADGRFALRKLRRSPGFTVAAVITLALAIGANALVFAVMNALFLRPLNVPHGDSLYAVQRGDDTYIVQSYPDYLDLRDRQRSFTALAAYSIAEVGFDSGRNLASVWGFETSGNYFEALGIQPYLGRFFHSSDEQGNNSAPYVVLSYAYWHTHFQDDRGVLGRQVRLNKHPFIIIGVAPPEFHGTLLIFSPNFFVPIVNHEQIWGSNQLNDRSQRGVFEVLGHLKVGVNPAEANADLSSIGADLHRSYPNEDDQNTFTLVRPALHGNFFAPAMRAFIAGLMLLAGLILLAACANLGSLFAARAADRGREVALRLALGSRTSRILRQLMTEALFLSLAGGAVGLAGSLVLLHRLSTWQPFPQFPMNMPVNPDVNVYLVALALSLASALLFAAVPVRQVFHTNPYEVIKAGSTARIGRRATLRDILLVLQIAICAVLVTSSMVAVRGLTRSLHSNLGINPSNALLVYTDLKMAGYSPDQVPTMQKRMIDATKAIPGVIQVALIDIPPLQMGWSVSKVFDDKTTDLKSSNAVAQTVKYQISPDYFRTAGTALLSGRSFTWNDDDKAPRVAVVNHEFAAKVFGSGMNAVGKHYKMPDGSRIEVVGIVEDGKYTANIAETPQPAMFLPILQYPASQTSLVVRSNRDPRQLAAAIHTLLRDLDPGLPAFIQTWNEQMNGALFASRVATVSLGALGMMGAMLSITGIFGMAAYSVSKRLKELGIRVALGAKPREVLHAALGRAVKLLALGSAAGLLLGILASRVLAFIVYQATPRDPLVLAGVISAMALLGLIATWIPAQRALSLDPSTLLREE